MTINNRARILPRKTELTRLGSALRKVMDGMFRDQGKRGILKRSHGAYAVCLRGFYFGLVCR